jgi:hypothetical protein
MSVGDDVCCVLQVHMADNNGRIVYTVPHRDWGRNYGVKVFRTDVPASGSAAVTTKVRRRHAAAAAAAYVCEQVLSHVW